MSKRKGGSAATSSVPIGSTGQVRRDRVTQGVFSQLCTRVPLLATNPAALTQLTGIVYDSLRDLRQSEDRTLELCDGALTSDGCPHCSWQQKSFCEVCGTDFRKTAIKHGYPMFLPAVEDHRLHIDVCMLCSETCVDQLIKQREKLENEKEVASGSTGGRLTRSAKDPHLSTWSFLFHASAYVLILYALFLGNYTLDAVPYFLTAWNLIGNLLLYGLWLLNMLLSWSAGGSVSNVYRLRQALSYIFSINFVLCSGMTLIFWGLFFAHPSGVKTPTDPTTPFEEQMKHTLPIILMLIELHSFPHVKVNRQLELFLCISIPSLFLYASYHKRYISAFQVWPYPFFAHLTTPTHFGLFTGVVVALLIGLTWAFQTVRDRIWMSYIVPKHLQVETKSKQTGGTGATLQEAGVPVKNSGLVLMHFYLPTLFKHLELLDGKIFKDTAASKKATHYLQYLVTGTNRKTEEKSLSLNKVLCGLPVSETVGAGIEITEDEQKLLDDLIPAVLAKWPSFSNGTVASFRGSFLVRDGMLTEREDRWELVVEERSYDIILKQAPTPFAVIKHTWMEKPLHVSWKH